MGDGEKGVSLEEAAGGGEGRACGFAVGGWDGWEAPREDVSGGEERDTVEDAPGSEPSALGDRAGVGVGEAKTAAEEREAGEDEEEGDSSEDAGEEDATEAESEAPGIGEATPGDAEAAPLSGEALHEEEGDGNEVQAVWDEAAFWEAAGEEVSGMRSNGYAGRSENASGGGKR